MYFTQYAGRIPENEYQVISGHGRYAEHSLYTEKTPMHVIWTGNRGISTGP
jgi:hypothetical protein